MAFDPNAPFDVEAPQPAASTGFDPNADFEVAAPAAAAPTPAQPGFWGQLGADFQRGF